MTLPQLQDVVCLILVMLLFSVVCGTETYIPHRYHFVNENKTWSEAQAYCREKYTDLATINNMYEMMKLNNTLKEETAEQAWIGLQREGTGEWEWTLGGQTSYTNWYTGDPINWQPQPNNYGGSQYCVEIDKPSGEWFDDQCEYQYQFVCYEENNTGPNKYILINDSKTWFDALDYCREKYTDLANVKNQTEKDEILSVIQQSSVGEFFWLGLFNNSWKWSDGSNSLFQYWSSDLLTNTDGTENCAAVDMTEKKEKLTWNDEKCNNRFPFICHENKLILINQTLTWWEALNYCRNYYYDLVSVRTEEMQLWVNEVAQNASTEYVWLGLRHDCTQRVWFWVYGSMICYQNWAPGNGTWNEDCSQEKRSGAVQSGGEQQWIHLPESYKLNFICTTYDG